MIRSHELLLFGTLLGYWIWCARRRRCVKQSCSSGCRVSICQKWMPCSHFFCSVSQTRTGKHENKSHTQTVCRNVRQRKPHCTCLDRIVASNEKFQVGLRPTNWVILILRLFFFVSEIQVSLYPSGSCIPAVRKN